MQKVTTTIAEFVILVFSAILLWVFYIDPFGGKVFETIKWQILNRPADAIGFLFMPLIALVVMLFALIAKRVDQRGYWLLVLAALTVMCLASGYLLFIRNGMVPSMFLIVPFAYLAAKNTRS